MTTLSPPPGFGAPPIPPPEKPQVEKSKRSRDRRISWATGDKLCQVRLFAAEDAPALSGAVQEQLQAKPARNLHVFNSVIRLPSRDDAPPGFGGVAVKPKPDPVALAAIVPQISWRVPSVFKLDPSWLVMTGGASNEVGFQTQREVRTLEAVYPRPSSIPDSPAEPLEPQEPYEDASTPQIPLVPLEEEDGLDGIDVSMLPFGPRFLSQGSAGQVAAVQMVPPSAPVMSNARLEKVMKQYIGEPTPGTMQDALQTRKEIWRDSSSVLTGRPPILNHSSDPPSGRPASAVPRLLPDLHGTNHNGVEPDVAAAAAAAFAALSKSKEVGSMIDNQLLIQILSDPSLIQSLTAGSPFTLANSKSDPSTSISMDGMSRAPEKINQAEAMNGASGGRNQWISHASTSYSVSSSSSGQDVVRPRIGEAYSNGAAERFPRTAGSDRSSTFVPGSVSNGAHYSESTNTRRVGSGTASRQSNSSGAPPGFGNSNTTSSIPPGFGNNSSSQQGSQTQLGPALSRALSRTDEQYFKSLIMQHGCADDDDENGRTGMETPSNTSSVRATNNFSPSEASRWYGRDEVDGGRSERYGRERRESEKNGIDRPKSRKVCIYYGTPRGCRNGDNCTFVHELTDSERTRAEKVRNAPTHLQYAKRLKVDG